MSAGVVTVGRRAYAVGLYWENSPSGRISQTAREAARQPGQQAEFYAVRAGTKEGRVPQFGLGQVAAGHKSSMPSFAACLANQQPGSWAGAFRMREGTVITIVRDELIVPDGDLLFQNETDARDRLLQEIGFGGLAKIYAPEAWAIPGADSMPIALLMDERRDVTLRPVSTPKKLILFGALGVVLLAAVIAVGWYMQAQENERNAEALARAQAMVPSALRSQKPVYPPPVRYWEDTPQPLLYVEACRVGLMSAPLAVNGWVLSALNCTGPSMSLRWGHISAFSSPPSGSVVDPGITSASLNIPLTSLVNRGHEDLANPTDVTKRYLRQNWPGSLARMPDDPPPPPPPDYKGEWNPPPPPWIKRSFTLTVPVLPGSLTTFLAGLPGVVINKMTYTPAGGAWQIDGVIYENRI